MSNTFLQGGEKQFTGGGFAPLGYGPGAKTWPWCPRHA